MILDALINADRYAPLHPRFARGFEFLRRADLAKLADGTHPIEGDALFAMVSHPKTKPSEQRVWEAHRRYIDIQYIVAGGVERMGWSLLEKMTPSKPYDAEGDYAFFTGQHFAEIDVAPGHFVIFFPHDVHAPCLGPPGQPLRVIHKVVLKVAAD